jgi:hypothetical protein
LLLWGPAAVQERPLIATENKAIQMNVESNIGLR